VSLEKGNREERGVDEARKRKSMEKDEKALEGRK
jgi:hypothetical protein